MPTLLRSLLLLAATLGPALGLAQPHPDPAALMAAQREAMQALAFMDGTWRGTATHQMPGGAKVQVIQTERVGPMLDGSIKVIEGRGYDQAGKTAFHAFGIVSYNPATRGYSLRSHAMGRTGDFELTPTATGFVWKVPAGPGMTIRYTATIREGTWTEIGERLVGDREPVPFFEMSLQRLGGTDWPAGGGVEPR